MIIIETPRLEIRSYEYGDEQEILDLLQNNRDHLKFVLSDWVSKIDNIDEAHSFIKKMKMGILLKNIFALGVWLKSESKLIGEQVFFKIDWRVGEMETGSYIHYDYQNKGITTEAKRATINFFFQNYQLKKINTFIHIKNIASQKMIEKSGFYKELETDSLMKFFITPEMISI